MKNTYICELTTSNEKHSAESTLMFPIKNSRGNVYAVLEVKLTLRRDLSLYRLVTLQMDIMGLTKNTLELWLRIYAP